MGISVVSRTKDDPQAADFVDNITRNFSDLDYELIIVDSSIHKPVHSSDPDVKIIRKNEGMFPAKITGIRAARGENVLFLDADQRVTKELVHELYRSTNDALLIRERSMNSNLMGKLLDFQRRDVLFFSESKHYSPFVTAVPRFFKLEIVLEAADRLRSEGCISHEDSILYYEAYDLLRSIGTSRNSLLNIDPSFIAFVKKSYGYGRSVRGIYKSGRDEKCDGYEELITKLNKSYKELYTTRLSPGLVVTLIRMVWYLLGINM